MNFLQLCREVALDSGTVAGVPSFTSVAGASGRIAQVVAWVRDAYIDIQNERPDWQFMRREFTSALTINKIEYSASDFGLTDVAEWLPDIHADGWANFTIYETGLQANEGEIRQIAYPEFRARYQRGSHDANQPTEWATSPLGALLLGTKPDKAYVIRGEYRRTPETLVLDADTPVMPARFHRVIVAEAIRLMARSDESFNVVAEKTQQYERLRNALVIDQTPKITFGGGSLA